MDERKSGLVSIVVPVYNAGQFLAETISCVQAQTYRAWELLLVDDGSSDDSREIIRQRSAKDERVRLIIQEENSGAAGARNRGIQEARGQYLCFLDADDFFDKNMLKLSFQKAMEENADICIYKAFFYDNETGEISACNFAVKENELPQNHFFSRSQITGNIFKAVMGWAWDKLYRRNFVLNHGLRFQEQRTTNDMYFVYASLLKAGRITILDKRLYYQRRNVKTSLSNTREMSWQCFYYALRKVRDELVEMGIYEEYKQDFINYALHSCIWNFNSLKEPYAEQLFHKLRDGWFADLEINNFDEEYFSNKEEYGEYVEMSRIPLGIPNAYCSYRINYWKNKYESKEARMDMQVVISEKEILTIGQMKEKLLWNRMKRMEVEKRMRNGGDAEYSLNEIRNSFSYKLAMMLTWFPRKLRQIGNYEKDKKVELEIMKEEMF